MKTFLTIIKAVKSAFPGLAAAKMVLVAGNSFAASESLERYHLALTEKYGYQVFNVKQFDYFCFAIIESSEDRGTTMDWNALPSAIRISI